MLNEIISLINEVNYILLNNHHNKHYQTNSLHMCYHSSTQFSQSTLSRVGVIVDRALA